MVDHHRDEAFLDRHDLLALIANLRDQLTQVQEALRLAQERSRRLTDAMTRTVLEYGELLSETGTRIMLIGPEADERHD